MAWRTEVTAWATLAADIGKSVCTTASCLELLMKRVNATSEPIDLAFHIEADVTVRQLFDVVELRPVLVMGVTRVEGEAPEPGSS